MLAPLPPNPDNQNVRAAGWSLFDEEMKKQIRRAWPEMHGADHPIFRIVQMERIAWRHKFDFKKLAAPWCVWGTGATSSVGGYGACNVVFKPRVTVYYVAQSVVPGQTDVAGYVQERLFALEQILRQNDFTGFQFWDEEGITYDVSDENPANSTFVHANLPMFAGSFSFNALFGYIAKREKRIS